MPIGEFGGPPHLPGNGSAPSITPLYWLYEWGQAALNPSRALADVTRLYFKNPLNPFAHTTFGKSIAATAEIYERAVRRYAKPEWRIDSATVGGERVPVRITTVWERPFCRLLHFERVFEHPPRHQQPKVLIVAPMSGHYPTLLRGTVEAFLPQHDVYVTEWVDARMVPLSQGRFDLDDYIDYPDFDAAPARRRLPRDRRMPAVGPRARRCRLDGGEGRPVCPAFHDPHGWSDRLAGKADRGQSAR